jgi:hypothetical protein
VPKHITGKLEESCIKHEVSMRGLLLGLLDLGGVLVGVQKKGTCTRAAATFLPKCLEVWKSWISRNIASHGGVGGKSVM